MAVEQQNDRGTVQLNMGELYNEVAELVGEEEAARLWKENGLDTGEHWPGKWAKAMEVVDGLRDAVGES